MSSSLSNFSYNTQSFQVSSGKFDLLPEGVLTALNSSTGSILDARLPSTMTGKTFTGDLTLQNNKGLYWAANTDWARIRFESTGDGAGLSNVYFRTGDNGDEG